MTTTAPKGIPDSAIRALAEMGITRAEAARRLGVYESTMRYRANALGLTFGKTKPRDTALPKLADLTPQQQADVEILCRRLKYTQAQAIRIVIRPKVKVRPPQ